jgi:ADP-heptose:LPS heptosyltransferase
MSRRLLFIRLSSFGDVVIQTATLSWLKSVDPDLKITFVTNKSFSKLLEGHPLVDELICFNKGEESFFQFIKRLKAIHKNSPFDFIFDAHGVTKSWLIRLCFIFTPQLVVGKRRWRRTLLTRFPFGFFDLWSSKWLGLENQTERTRLDFKGIFESQSTHTNTTSLKSYPFQFSELVPQNYIVIAPGASFESKKYPLKLVCEYIMKFLNHTEFKKFKIVLTAGSVDEIGDAFHQIQDSRFINLAGKTNVEMSASLIENAKGIIANDSLATHLGQAYNTPTITLFGPTSEHFGFSTYQKNSLSISHAIWCRPCSTTGKSKCFRTQQFCFTKTTPDYLLQKSVEMFLW